MNVDLMLLLGAVMALLYIAFELALSYGLGFVMFVFVLGVIGITIAYQSAQASDDTGKEIQVFAGVELDTPEDVEKLINELEAELVKKPKEE